MWKFVRPSSHRASDSISHHCVIYQHRHRRPARIQNPPHTNFPFLFFFSACFQMQCHASPIYTLERNPSFSKNFITVGDWNARIWSEDCKESSIIWTKYCSVDLTDGCWSPTKCSLFYLSRVDGNLEAWDLLQQQSEPILTVKVRVCVCYHSENIPSSLSTAAVATDDDT